MFSLGLALVLEGLDDFVEGGGLDFLVLPPQILVYLFVEFAKSFAQFGVEMVFDAVVGPD